MKLTQLQEAKYAFQKPHDQFRACGYCGNEVGSIGGGDESLDYCDECMEVVEGNTVMRRLNVKDEFGTMTSDWENVE